MLGCNKGLLLSFSDAEPCFMAAELLQNVDYCHCRERCLPEVLLPFRYVTLLLFMFSSCLVFRDGECRLVCFG